MRTMCFGARRSTSARFPQGPTPERLRVDEPPQIGERRVLIEREGTTGYLKLVFHAPAATDADFFPMLVLDAALTGAKGVNLWSSFRGAPPQRKARLYTALVERGLASTVSGALLPTAQPFLYTLSFTAMEGVVRSRPSRRRRSRHRAGATGRASSRRSRCARSASCGRGSSSRTTASPTSRISLDISRRSSGPDFLSALQRADRCRDGRAGAGTSRAAASDAATRTVGWFRPSLGAQ